MANSIRGYKINVEKKIITITKSLANKSKKMNSEEYDMLAQLAKDYPNFSIKTSTKKKSNKYKDLTIPFMRTYITQNKDKTLLDAFEKELIQYAEASTKYFHMKSWFLTNCPEYEKDLDQQKIDRELNAIKKAAERKEQEKAKRKAKEEAKAAAKEAAKAQINSPENT